MPPHLPRSALAAGLILVSGLATTPRAAAGQLADAFADAAGGDLPLSVAGDSTTGFPANPAGLSDGSGWEFLFTPVRIGVALGPITGRDIARVGGDVLSRETRETWLTQVGTGTQRGRVTAGLGPIALRRGPVEIRASTTVVGSVRLPADAVELLLFGNAGRDGSPGDFRLTDSALDGAIFSNVGVAWGGRPASDVVPELTVGGRIHATIGHGLVVTRDAGSLIDGDQATADLKLPTISASGNGVAPGFGVGMDLGLAWRGVGSTTGVTLFNAVRTFTWASSDLRYRAGETLIEGAGVETDFEARPVSEAPPTLRALARRLRPTRRVEIEHVRAVGERLHLRLVFREPLERGLSPGASDARLIGAEWDLTSVVDIAGHVGVVDGRPRLGSGLRAGFGAWSVAAAWLVDRGDDRDGSSVSLSLRHGLVP
ncbi:MAG TPA: hypothetical protein VJ925_01205 [Longimicrobiales bacterium]|nr:hypothetical protein [Longimicrobiales bacterium]